MFCNHCGSQIDDALTVCPHCGTPVEQPAPTAPRPTMQPGPPPFPQPVVQTAPAGIPSPAKVLTWGILGLAFSSSGLLGLIFSIVGLKMAGAFQQGYGQLFGQAKVGRILAKVGLIVSIVMMVFWLFYGVLFAVLMENILNPDLYYAFR